MLFGRSDQEFWQMTPGQLGVLIRHHNKTTPAPAGADTPTPSAPRQGTAADLTRFAALPLA